MHPQGPDHSPAPPDTPDALGEQPGMRESSRRGVMLEASSRRIGEVLPHLPEGRAKDRILKNELHFTYEQWRAQSAAAIAASGVHGRMTELHEQIRALPQGMANKLQSLTQKLLTHGNPDLTLNRNFDPMKVLNDVRAIRTHIGTLPGVDPPTRALLQNVLAAANGFAIAIGTPPSYFNMPDPRTQTPFYGVRRPDQHLFAERGKAVNGQLMTVARFGGAVGGLAVATALFLLNLRKDAKHQNWGMTGLAAAVGLASVAGHRLKGTWMDQVKFLGYPGGEYQRLSQTYRLRDPAVAKSLAAMVDKVRGSMPPDVQKAVRQSKPLFERNETPPTPRMLETARWLADGNKALEERLLAMMVSPPRGNGLPGGDFRSLVSMFQGLRNENARLTAKTHIENGLGPSTFAAIPKDEGMPN